MNGSTTFERVRYAVGKIFGGIVIGPEEYQTQISIAGNHSRFAVRDDSINQVVRISENEVNPRTLGKYLDAYTALPEEQRPLFIIETHDEGSSIDERISRAPDEMNFTRFRPDAVLEKHIVERLPSASIEELVDQYAENSFSAVSRLSVRQFENAIVRDASLHEELAARLFHVRSIANERGKFATTMAAKALSSRLDNVAADRLSDADQRIALASKILSNLWLLYCEESPRLLFDNAMAIAKSLDDELMQAHCIRLINTIEPHGTMTDQMLHRAAKTFHEHELFDFSNFCLNNAYVGKFYTDETIAGAFADLTTASAESIDGFLGRAIMINNVGVAYMIEGDFENACYWFSKVPKEPATPLHSISAEVNLAITQFVDGCDPNGGHLLRLARKTVRQIERNYRYQTANLLLNILRLASGRPEEGEIHKLVSEAGVFDDPVVTTDHGTLARLVRVASGDTQLSGVGPGRRARFVEKYGLVPIFHHAWL
ncbi:MAG: hypothetical protein AB7I79_18880 [Rhizobiaceae bacterium]